MGLPEQLDSNYCICPSVLHVRPSTVNKNCTCFFWCIFLSFLFFLGARNQYRPYKQQNQEQLQPPQLFFPSQTGEKSNLLPSATSKIQSQDLLLVVKDVYTERRNRNVVKTEVWLNVNLAWLLYLVFLSPPLKGRIPVAVVAMVLRRTRCLLQSENYVCGCVVNNYPFWQVRLVYSELTQYHFSYSKVGRGSSGHSPCVKANAASAVQEKPEN